MPIQEGVFNERWRMTLLERLDFFYNAKDSILERREVLCDSVVFILAIIRIVVIGI